MGFWNSAVETESIKQLPAIYGLSEDPSIVSLLQAEE